MILETIERRLKRLEMAALVEYQLSVQTGKSGQWKKAWKIVRHWNRRRIELGLSEYW